jgi:hypothetical protein
MFQRVLATPSGIILDVSEYLIQLNNEKIDYQEEVILIISTVSKNVNWPI